MCVHCTIGGKFLKARWREYDDLEDGQTEMRYIGQVPSLEVQENYRAGYARYAEFNKYIITFAEGDGLRLLTPAELEAEVFWAAQCMNDGNMRASDLPDDFNRTLISKLVTDAIISKLME